MKNVKIKQRLSLASLATAALATLLVSGSLTSCSKSETEPTPDRSEAINLSASVQATTESRAAVEGTTFPANTDNVFRLTAFSGTTAPTTNWSATPYFNNIQVNSGAASALTLATTQYYPVNGDKVYFYGYAPEEVRSITAGTASAAPVANYTITGQQDIMAAQVITGIAKITTGAQVQPKFTFTHKLMQLRFKVVADASYETGKKVSKILVKGIKTSAKLNIATGALAFDGAADQTLSLPITVGTKDDITTMGTEMDGCIMLEPTGSGGVITLDVTAGGILYKDIEVTLSGTDNGAAGTSHLITLTFKRVEIAPSATASIGTWQTIDRTEQEVTPPPPPLAIGELKGGGIVYEVNGSKVKVLSLDQGASLEWSALERTYKIGATGQNETDGKSNVAAMKTYSANTVANGTTGVFATDFPAAGFCESAA